MLVRSKFIVYFISLLLVGSCTGEKAPATPIETFKTYTKAIKQKDIATMKLLLSKDTIKMHELEAQAQGTTVDEIVKRETLFTENQKSVKLRNEKIDGDKATLEVENSFGTWETVPFAKEDGEWKIDKKGFADRMLEENEKSNKELDDLINQGRQQQP
jgi:Domain of unknown function (DUF4878)